MLSKSKSLPILQIIIYMSLFLISNAPLAIAKDNASDEKLLVKSNQAFAMDLYSKLSSSKENVFFSPYSISTALAMVYGGARGPTEKQMAKTLHFNLKQKNLHEAFYKTRMKLNDTRMFELIESNALWLQQDHSFTKNYTELIATNYGGGLNRVDFKRAPEAAGKKINSWVQKKTNNRISDLIQADTLQPDTRLVLTNAIYFKGKWHRPFEKEDTKDAIFWRTRKNKIKVPFMFQHDRFKYMENENLKAVILPYSGDDISMIIILSKKIDGIDDVERLFNAKVFRSWEPLFHRAEVKVYLPKFRISYEALLAKTLISMGMTNAFEKTADFSGLDGTKTLFLDDIIHKSFIDVNEEGTEATSASAAGKILTSYETPLKGRPKEFRADHPFIFLIQDSNSGNILFMGRVKQPR